MIGPEDWGALYRGWVPMVVALGAFTALSTLDVILVKHYFVPQLAGYYGAGSMVGKAFVFVGLALAQVMFPKASAAHARAEDSRHLLLKSLGLTAGFLTVSIVLTWGLATLIIRTLFGLQFLNPHTLFLIKGMGLAMTPLALVYVVLQYNLALQSRRFIHVLLADVLLLAGLLAFIHPSLEAVLWLVGLNHLGLLLAGLLTLPGTGKAAA
jgi:O-antigen/teichoic acid export membrane protein